MPFDSSRHAQPRHSTRKHSHDNELGIRRARGEISCAECRRLKLKCDKKIPCSSCIRRGCPSICPNGSLSSGQGTRFVLADTTELHAKISEMGQRIRQLEDALAILQSSISNEPHPLLRDELMYVKFGPESNVIPPMKRASDATVEVVNTLGTLTIGGPEESKYFGRSAGSETLLLAGAELDPTDLDPPQQNDESCDFSQFFPMSEDHPKQGPERLLNTLYSSLPDHPRASSLCETYFEHVAWQFQPVRREEMIHDLLIPVYRYLKEMKNDNIEPSLSIISPHKLAVLFLIFAQGALVDLTLEPYNSEAQQYFHLGRAALSLRSLFDSPEVATVQAVVLVAWFYTMAGRRYTIDSAWTTMALGSKLAQSIGLHRDPSRWNLDAKTVQRRRSLFWEMSSIEMYYSLCLGRPPSIRMSYVDCEFPADEETEVDGDGKPLIGFHQWKYEFNRDIFSQVLELTLTAEPPKYETVLDLDRRIREKYIPPHLNKYMSPDEPQYTPSAYMRGCLLGQYRSCTLIHIHRSFFAQVMLRHPANPLGSPYAPSLLAAYRCASGVIKSSLDHHERFPDLCDRWWGLWTNLFSSAIVVGTIVTRSPSSTMASNAFIELGLAHDLFEKASKNSIRVRSGFHIIRRLRDKAIEVYSQHRSGNPLPLPAHDQCGEDELALFGGQIKVIPSSVLTSSPDHPRGVSQKPSPSVTSESPPSSSESSSGNTSQSQEALSDVHPSVVDYISSLPASQRTRSYPLTTEFEPYNSQPYVSDPRYMPHPQTMSLNTEQPPAYSVVQSDRHMDYDAFDSAGYTSAIPFSSNEASAEGVMDLGMMMGNSGIDEQWKTFMQDTGIINYHFS